MKLNKQNRTLIEEINRLFKSIEQKLRTHWIDINILESKSEVVKR